VTVHEIVTVEGYADMVLLYYDEDASAGSGKVFFESIEGGLPIVAHQLITNDINDADLPASSFYRTRVARFRTFLKVLDFGALYPFTSTPEVRYKLGTYVPIEGYEIIVDDSGVQTFGYQGTPGFLIYERQVLPEYQVHVIPTAPGDENYLVTMAESSPVNYNVALKEPRVDSQSFRSLPQAVGIDINLSDGVIVNLELYYTFVTIFTSSSETRPKINVTL